MSYFDGYKKRNLTYQVESNYIEVNIDDINQGVSQNENFLFFRDNKLIKIYDRVCNHNSGKLFLQGNTALCPLHGWELDLFTGEYLNASCLKNPLLIINEYELDSPLIEMEVKKIKLNTLNFKSKKKLLLDF